MPPTIALLVACAPTEPPGPSGAVRAELRRESASFRSPWPGAGEVTLALRGGGDSAVEAWDPLGRGFDHSFRVAEPPTDGRPVVLEVTVDGDVVVDGDGRSATVRKSGTVLRYQGLAAWDEAGTPLPARLEATATGLRIVVQTLGAVGAITIDPLLYGTGWEVVGAPDNVDFGSSVAAADVDGDGFDDVIVADELHGDGLGRVVLYRGSATGPAVTPAWTVASPLEVGFATSVASAGDVNGDGFEDVVIGAPLDDQGQTDEGTAVLYLGSATGLGALPAWAVHGEQVGAQLGTAVDSAGDVNGDGFDDVIVGPPPTRSSTSPRGSPLCSSGRPPGSRPPRPGSPAVGPRASGSAGTWRRPGT